jgi:hypothetical protein
LDRLLFPTTIAKNVDASVPTEFRPNRFRGWNGDPFAFIPQGGGVVTSGHRCPGEGITMDAVKLALHFLTRCMTYEVVPSQDLSFDLRRMPTKPVSGFLIRRVRATTTLDSEPPTPRSSTPDLAVPANAGERGVAVPPR